MMLSFLNISPQHDFLQFLANVRTVLMPVTNLTHKSQENLLLNEPYEDKGLNVVSRYANHLHPSVREQVQNWKDQCVQIAIENNRSFTPACLQVETRTGNDYQCFILYDNTIKQMLGFIVSVAVNGKLSIEFCNYGTILNRNILQFGRTSKEDNNNMAGNFGEGMKVEINRLVSLGAQINFYTGKAIWNFYHSPQTELYVSFKPLNTQKPLHETHIVLHNVPMEAKIDINHYLFFDNTSVKVQDTHLEYVSKM